MVERTVDTVTDVGSRRDDVTRDALSACRWYDAGNGAARSSRSLYSVFKTRTFVQSWTILTPIGEQC